QGRHNPLVIDAKGTPRDEVVEFRFKQPAIHTALQIDPLDPQTPVYTMWHHTAQDWAIYPKAHQVVFLAPGERVLYRDLYVSKTPNLDHYKALLLAPRGQVDDRPRVPTIAPPYASRRAQRPAEDPPKPQSMPGSPTIGSLLDLLPFSFTEDDKSFTTRFDQSAGVRKRSASPQLQASAATPSRVRKRSASPLLHAAAKRRRKSDLHAQPDARSLSSANPVSAPVSTGRQGEGSGSNHAGSSRRHGKGRGKGKGKTTS
ncbi:hypothetical protein C2E23DRAFT_714463, partial [Lenzites betulinus]